MSTVDLQRRHPGPRADELLAELEAALRAEERPGWNETGHARLRVPGELEEARATVSARLSELGGDWPEHIAIL